MEKLASEYSVEWVLADHTSIYPKTPSILILCPLMWVFSLTQTWVYYMVGGEEEKGKVAPQLSFFYKNWTKLQAAFSKLVSYPKSSLDPRSMAKKKREKLQFVGQKLDQTPRSIFQVSIYPKTPSVLILCPLTGTFWLTQTWVCYMVGGEEGKGKVTPQLGLMMYPTSAVQWLASGHEMTKSAWYFIWHMIIYWRIFQ